MVSGEERARPHSAEDQARLVFTDLDLDRDLDRSSSSVDRKEALLKSVVREDPDVSDFWQRFDDKDGEVDIVNPCDPPRFLFSSLDLLARSKEIWMSSPLSTRNTWRPSPFPHLVPPSKQNLPPSTAP